jgi:fused signal recognition particle receptor
MFSRLKKSLRRGVEKLSRKAEEPPEKPKLEEPKPEKPKKEKVKEKPRGELKPEPMIEEPIKEEEKPEKPSVKERLGFREKLTKKQLTEKDLDEFFQENESDLMQSDVAVEVIDFLREEMKRRLVHNPVKRGKSEEFIMEAFRESLLSAVDQESLCIGDFIKRASKEDRPACVIFLGFNGSGKTTTIARIAKRLMSKKFKPVLAAADTFRAAAIEQLEIHGERLGLKVIKHQYGADSAAVIFDAVKYAKSKGCDVVLADTAGRTHTDKNLIDELKKVVRVNKPDLKILVVDSLTGNDAVEQARQFDAAVGVDAVVMTKTDVNEKGGSILSVCYTIKKPILFLGTGQGYEDLTHFIPKKFVDDLLG